ncbi:MAG: NADH-quinone oxidoreductase subunit L, partial [Tepidiformaceae bacterium]
HGDPLHPHESPWVMTLPLIILSVPAIAAGWFAYHEKFGTFISGALPEAAHEGGSSFEWGIALSSSLLALAGIGAAYAIYARKWVTSESLRGTFAPFAMLFENKYYMDKIYEDLFVKTIFQKGWNRLLQMNDRYVVDGIVNSSGRLTRGLSERARAIQTGQLQSYGLGFVAGVVILVVAVFAANPL